MNIYIQKQSQGTRITYLQLEETLARGGGGGLRFFKLLCLKFHATCSLTSYCVACHVFMVEN